VLHKRNDTHAHASRKQGGRCWAAHRAVEIRDVAELDVEVERHGWLRQRPRRGDRGGVGGVGVGPRGAAADEARADEDDEGGAHPEADHRGHQIQPGPQHLHSTATAPPSLPFPRRAATAALPPLASPPPSPAALTPRSLPKTHTRINSPRQQHATDGLSNEQLPGGRRIRAARRAAAGVALQGAGSHRRGVWDLSWDLRGPLARNDAPAAVAAGVGGFRELVKW